MVHSKVPDSENDPVLVEAIPYHFVRQYVSRRVLTGVEIEMGDLDQLRCFALGVNLINTTVLVSKRI